jgi:GT2 family glycosyltransferase
MKLLAIVVNYRTPKMTLDAVRTLLAALESIADAEVVVVDNDSQDGSFEILSRGVATLCRPGSAPVKVIASGKNGGFAYGVNVGIRHGLKSKSVPDFFYLLNSDAFPDPSAVRELLQIFQREPRAGIAGSYVYGRDGRPHQTAFRFPTPVSELERALRLGIASKVLYRWRVPLPLPDADCAVDWVAGASMMIRRQVIENVGLFDEHFFLYFEETDFCLRAKAQGWSTYYVRGSAVAHIGGASTGIRDNRSQRRMPSYWFDSRRHYFRKNHGEAYLALSDVLFALGFSLWRVRRKLQNKPDEDPPSLLADFVRHSLRARVTNL